MRIPEVDDQQASSCMWCNSRGQRRLAFGRWRRKRRHAPMAEFRFSGRYASATYGWWAAYAGGSPDHVHPRSTSGRSRPAECTPCLRRSVEQEPPQRLPTTRHRGLPNKPGLKARLPRARLIRRRGTGSRDAPLEQARVPLDSRHISPARQRRGCRHGLLSHGLPPL